MKNRREIIDSDQSLATTRIDYNGKWEDLQFHIILHVFQPEKKSFHRRDIRDFVPKI